MYQTVLFTLSKLNIKMPKVAFYFHGTKLQRLANAINWQQIADIPIMKGVGEWRTYDRLSGHIGMYGHCQWNGKIICNQQNQDIT